MGKIKTRIAMAGACLLTSISVALLFYSVSLRSGSYSSADIYLGSIWVFVLSLIISSPVLIPIIRKRLRESVTL